MPRRCMQQKPSPLPFPTLGTPPQSPSISTPVSLSSSTSTVAGSQALPDSPLSCTPPHSPSGASLMSGIPLVESRRIHRDIVPQISLTPPLPPRNLLVSPPTPPRPSMKKKKKAPPSPTPTRAPTPTPTPTPLLLPLLPLMTPPSTSTATSSCFTSTTNSSATSGVVSVATAAAAAGLPSAATQLPMHTLPPPPTSTSSFSTSSFSTSSTSCPESGSTSGSAYTVPQQHHSMISAVISTVLNNNNNSRNNNNNHHNNNGNNSGSNTSSNNNSNTSSSNNAAGFASCTSTPPLTRPPPSSSGTVPTAGTGLSVSTSKFFPAAVAAVGFPQMLGQENTKSKLISTALNSTTEAMGSKLFQRRSAVTRSTMNTNRRYSARDGTEEREKVARSIFGDVPLSDVERRYLAAALEGNMSQIHRCIQVGVNVNCRDYLGRTALQLSLQGDHYEETKFLMDHCNLDVIEEGLLHAIKLENVRMCDMILNHPVYSDERNRIRLEFQHGFYDQGESNSNFSPDITPVVLAAQCNNFDIVHMLLRKGFCIDTPHHYFCLCTECVNHKKFDRFVHSRSRLNAYRGLASTAYMALSSDDPVLTAFDLSRQLKSLEEKEKEHKSEYKALCDHCKNYAVELLELCRTNEEVMAALHGGADIHDLSRIRMAIKYEQKRFIAHASCQEHLMSIWYADVPWFQHQSFIVKLFIVPVGILFIPVTAIVYVFLPYSKIGEILRSPFMKFMNYMCSYMAFLVFLLIATTSKNTTSNSEPWVVRGFIIFYVFGMFWAECKQLWDEGVKEYFAQMWNYMDITMLALYTASYTIESIVSIKSNSYDDTGSSEFSDNLLPNPRVLALVLFSVANVLSFARIAYILPASETFGQLQISYGRMLQDVFKFICIYFTVMIAFICGLTSLYSYSGESNFKELLTTFETLFWAAFGMGNPKAPKETERGNHLVETVGNLMYGVYIIGAVVVLINMLIAMMSNTFEEIQDDEDVEWKFARAKLWISFIDGSGTLPIPFNIIPTPKSVFKLFVYLKKIFMRYLFRSGDDPTSSRTIIDYEYKTILHKVVLRYIHKMKYDKKGDVVRDEIYDAKEEIISNVLNTFNKLNARMDAIESNLMGLEAKIVPGNIYATNQPTDYCSTDTIAQDNRSLPGTQSLNPSPNLKERQPHQETRRNLLSTSPSQQSFTTEAQCHHSTEDQDWYDRSFRFGSSKSEGRPSRPRKQMDSVTEYEMSRSVPLHSKYFSHEV